MDIRELIGEATEYDKKLALEEKKPKSWCKSVSAFANSFGGTLVFGISNDDEIIGLADAEHDAETISEQIKTRLDPVPQFHMSFYEDNDGKKLILLNVLAGEETPYYYASDGVMEAYVRLGNESVKADSIEMKRLVLRGKNSSFDSLSTNDEAMDYSFSKLRERYKCWTGESLDDKEMLSFGLIDSRGKLTNAGALLADKSPIRWSRLFCTHWSGLTKGGGIVDAVDDAEYSGSLITLLDEGMAFIKRNTKTMWKKLPDSRVEMPEYCERSYFEALVNALVHRDYLINGSEVHIDIFDDRMRIYSPGGMPDGSLIQNRIIDAVPSTRRNPVLADVFQRLGYMERKGSGLSRIIEGYQKAYNYSDDKKPEFESSRVEFTVTFKNLNYGENEDFDADGVETGKSGVEIIDNGVESGVETGKNGVESDVETDKNIIEMDVEEKIINLLEIEPKLSQKTISQRLNIPYRTLQRIMEKMVTTGKIRREGAARGGYWKVL